VNSQSVSHYHYLIVGAGLFGAVFAHEMHKAGKRCLVIDKRPHSGGNVYCEKIDDINVHKYGAHIFHTNDLSIWKYVNQFVDFNNYINSPLAYFKGELYNLPFNMNTFYKLWGTTSPLEAKKKIEEQTKNLNIEHPANLEEQALKLVGTEIYDKFIKSYTQKQWGKKPSELPASIIKRIPVRFTFNNNYFDDRYQGIPIGGYNKLIAGLLKGIDLRLNTDFFKDKTTLRDCANNIVFTGRLDEYFNYCFGDLEYRSLNFEIERLDIENFQGNAVINYTDFESPYTRIYEHKHFEFGKQPTTVISKEYPKSSGRDSEPYYPVNDVNNQKKLKKYMELAKLEQNTIFGGRLAEYKYYDMHQVIASALKRSRSLLSAKR
jgi:UDP-galactopyranose mutase